MPVACHLVKGLSAYVHYWEFFCFVFARTDKEGDEWLLCLKNGGVGVEWVTIMLEKWGGGCGVKTCIHVTNTRLYQNMFYGNYATVVSQELYRLEVSTQQTYFQPWGIWANLLGNNYIFQARLACSGGFHRLVVLMLICTPAFLSTPLLFFGGGGVIVILFLQPHPSPPPPHSTPPPCAPSILSGFCKITWSEAVG